MGKESRIKDVRRWVRGGGDISDCPVGVTEKQARRLQRFLGVLPAYVPPAPIYVPDGKGGHLLLPNTATRRKLAYLAKKAAKAVMSPIAKRLAKAQAAKALVAAKMRGSHDAR